MQKVDLEILQRNFLCHESAKSSFNGQQLDLTSFVWPQVKTLITLLILSGQKYETLKSL